MSQSDYGSIIIRGARENNLKNVALDIPKRRITVFTGVSGSGKSSLVFGTIAAESQRLINETYPAFVQQFMPHYGQPDADQLENISAAIIVELIAGAGCELLYLAPYSPDFNPIELAWAWIKRHVRRLAPRDKASRIEAINTVIKNLPEKFCGPWYKQAGVQRIYD